MSVELENTNKEELIPMCDLKDGQIAVITSGFAQGEIIQRNANHCIIIGEPIKETFTVINNIPVRVLKEGEKIVIKNNQ